MASPKGVAISFWPGLLRPSAPRNDTILISFVLKTFFCSLPYVYSLPFALCYVGEFMPEDVLIQPRKVPGDPTIDHAVIFALF